MRHSTKIDHLFKIGDPIEEDLTNMVVLITTKHIIATINQIAHIHLSINSSNHRHLSTNPIVHNLHLIDNLEDISKVRKEVLHHKGYSPNWGRGKNPVTQCAVFQSINHWAMSTMS